METLHQKNCHLILTVKRSLSESNGHTHEGASRRRGLQWQGPWSARPSVTVPPSLRQHISAALREGGQVPVVRAAVITSVALHHVAVRALPSSKPLQAAMSTCEGRACGSSF